MPRNITPHDNGVSDALTSASTGFDAIVHVPAGTSIDEALAAAEEAPVRAATSWTDTPEFDADEVGFPRLRLGQGLTAEVAEGHAKMGQWLLSGYDVLDEVTVVPVMFSRDRAKRQDPAKRDSDIVCTSPDGKVGYGDPGGDCKTCPFSKWMTDPKTGRRTPPACQLSYHYAVWVVEHEALAEVVFTRTSEQYAHLINNLTTRFGLGKFALRLTSTVKIGPNRRWAEPQVKLVPLTPDMVEGAIGLINPTAPTIMDAQPALTSAN